MDDQIEHSVIEKEFGCLEARRQDLADRLLDDAGTGETDQRRRFGDQDVAQHAE